MRYIFFIPVEWIFMGFIAICIGCNVYLAHKDPSTITTVAGFVLIAGYVAIIVTLIETVAEIFIDVGKLKAVAAFPILLQEHFTLYYYVQKAILFLLNKQS